MGARENRSRSRSRSRSRARDTRGDAVGSEACVNRTSPSRAAVAAAADKFDRRGDLPSFVCGKIYVGNINYGASLARVFLPTDVARST